MADANLKLVITAVDKASGTVGRVGQSVEKMGVAGVAAAGAIAAFGISSVKAFSDAQKSQAKLQDTYKRFPRLQNVALSALRDYNAELQRKTRFDDDAIASGQAILGQYELTGQQLQELTPLVADYAAKTGKSFEDASTDIGKALMGSGRALKAVGIDFKDTGSQAGNLRQIMVGLRSQVGGFAEDEAKTGAGAAERLKNQFGELQESVGAQLLPALTSLAGLATDLLMGFNALPAPVRNVAFAVTLLGTAALVAAPKVLALKQLLAESGGVRGAAGKFRTAIGGVTGAIGGPFTLALTASVAALGIWAQKNAESRAEVEDLTSAIEADSLALGDNTRALVVNRLEKDGLLKKAQMLGISTKTLTDAAMGDARAQREVSRAIDAQLPKTEAQRRALAEGRAANQAQAEAADDLRRGLGKLTAQTDEAAAAARRKASAMRGDASMTRLAKKELDGYIKSLDELAKRATPGSPASARIASERDRLGSTPPGPRGRGKPKPKVKRPDGRGANVRASGGPVRMGQPYIVGEKRPELFIPESDGVILPRVPSALGGTTVIVNAQAVSTDRDIAAAVVKALRAAGVRGQVSIA